MSGKRIMKTSGRPVALLVSLALILTAVLGATAAYLMTKSDGITNTFTPAEVTCEVKEEFDDLENKKIIKVQNTGDADAYIRVALVATWQKSDGTVYAKAPTSSDYTVSRGDGWVQSGDYYYHKAAVNVDATTDTAITVVSKNTAAPADGYSLHVEVLAEAVQVVQGDKTAGAAYAWGETAAGVLTK